MPQQAAGRPMYEQRDGAGGSEKRDKAQGGQGLSEDEMLNGFGLTQWAWSGLGRLGAGGVGSVDISAPFAGEAAPSKTRSPNAQPFLGRLQRAWELGIKPSAADAGTPLSPP